MKTTQQQTIIHHWVTDKLEQDYGIKSLEQIEQSGLLQTECKVLPHLAEDQMPMDVLWFTKNDNLPGASTSIPLSILDNAAKLCDLLKRRVSASDLEGRIVLRPEPKTYRRYSFVAEDIGAVWWHRYRAKWCGISVKKKNWVKSLDLKSRINGDDVTDYYVCEQDVPISKAIEVRDYTFTQEQVINNLGFKSVADIYTRQLPLLEKVYG